ncbi:MAG: LysR substrate-binding domain-containing protein, partial [Trebonia sp.]
PGGSADLAREVASGGLDLALLSLPGDPPAGLAVRQLAHEPMALICAASHPLAGRGTVPLRELAGETFVDFPVGWGTRAIVDRAFAAAGIDRQVSFEVADYATAAALVGNGLGVAFVQASAARGLDEVARVAVDPPLDWRILVATSATRRASAAARAFLAELLSQLSVLGITGCADCHHRCEIRPWGPAFQRT